MSETPAGLLLFGVIFLLLLFIGIFAAIIVYIGRSREEPEVEEQVAPIPAPSAPPPAATPDTPSDAHIEPVLDTPADPGEVMRVIRDAQMGRVLVEVDGVRYTHIREITDARVGRRVLWAIADLVRFTGGMATNPQAVRNVMNAEPAPAVRPGQTPAALSAEASVPQSAAAVVPVPVVPATPLVGTPPLPTSSPAEAPSPPEKYSLVDYFRRGFQAKPSAEPLPSPTAFIDEIEGILQGYIQSLPTPLASEVHVTSGETGVLQITVGNNAYGSADEVPDTQIRELIKAAVAEWEKR